jgi:hypothetical protein
MNTIKKILVITANIGGIDSVKPIPQQTVEFDRVYITAEDSPYHFPGLDNRLKAKYFKLMTHELYQHEIIVWIDGNVQIKTGDFIEKLVACLEENYISISRHPVRNCIFDEAHFIITEIDKGNKYLKARYNPEAILSEINYYKSMGHPEGAGLYWCGLFARINNKKVNRFFESVWNDNVLRSNFDQNSFVFYALQHGMKINTIEWGDFYKNSNYELIHHSKLM